jgi:hypothetical protein
VAGWVRTRRPPWWPTSRPTAADDLVRTFAAFDGALRDAAAREGFVLVP